MKKGIWLTTNFFVMIIISLTAFGMGLFLVNKFFGTAQQIQEDIDRQTEEEIKLLLYDGERVSFPLNRKEVRRGNTEVFGLGVLNTLDSGPGFTISVEDGPLIQTDGSELQPGQFNSLGYIDSRQRNIENNEFEILSIPVDVPRDSLIGTYILNVYICNGTVTGSCDGNPNNELYDGFVHKLYVKVP